MDDSNDSIVEIPKPRHRCFYINYKMDRAVGTQEKMIVLEQEGKSAGWSVDARLRSCSQFLQCLEDEHQLNDQVALCITLPQSLTANAELIALIEDFYQAHHYSRQHIKINKITMEGYKKAFDSVSLQYLEQKIISQNEKTIRQLLDLVQYLKFNDLKQLLTVYVASQYFYDFNDKLMHKKIREAGAFYSRQEQIVLHQRLKPYAQQLSVDLLQNLRNKYSLLSKQVKPSGRDNL